MDKILGWAIGILIGLCVVSLGAVTLLAPLLAEPRVPTEEEKGCISSGGTVRTSSCCGSVGDFPDTCLIGACGCAPASSHEVRTCDCGPAKCFNGTACVRIIRNFEECVAAGYPVMESYPRQCRVPGGPSFTEVIPVEMSAEICQAARGHWNECSNRCRLDNQGKPDVMCTAMCEALCECGGIAGFGCPEGFSCRMPAGIADALGYCVAEG